MRIAYYTSDERRQAGIFNVKEVDNVYKLGENKLVCDNLVFLFENEEPYQNRSLDDLMVRLLKDGYIDLRSLRLNVR